MTVREEQAKILSNYQVGPALFEIELASPEIARALLPGQFVHALVPGLEAHILRRPFSVYQTNPDAGTFVVLYQVVGEGTQHLSTISEGATMSVMGPIGCAWDISHGTKRALCVGGGVGSASLYMLTERLVAQGVDVDIVLGARTKDALTTRDAFEQLIGHNVNAATDDGSFGYTGFCTVPAAELIRENSYDAVYTCGPDPVMRAVMQSADDANIPCQVSLERRMACGIGACLSCVVDTIDGRKRACVDGPIFDAEKVVW